MVKKFQPSSNTQGEAFMSGFCYKCIKWPHSSDAKKQCHIALMTMARDVDDEDYPEEWQYSDDGPVCTAFKSREEHNAARRATRKPVIATDKNTLDLF